MNRMTSEELARLNTIKTPAYVVDERLLTKNLELLDRVQQATGCDILLALKGFSMYYEFPLIGKYLAGITSSSLFEAKLGYEEMGKEVHIYSPAYHPHEFEEILTYVDHIVFNSPSQYRQYKEQVNAYMERTDKTIEIGLRVNPEYSEIETAIYDPCDANSRLGTTADYLTEEDFEGLDGIHFHAMCEQGADTLERIIQVVEKKFGAYMHKMKWVNFGGGHHITREGYNVDLLIATINRISKTYGVHVYLEPGEAIALNTGYLVTSVLDLINNRIPLAIVDASAACHMPDVLEMPYRPYIIGSGADQEKAHSYRLGGTTCLAGDVIGDYSFDKPLAIGDRLVFTDMAHYTMVKNNTFNGVNLPSIAIMNDDEVKVIREFGYEDYKTRLS